jgi:hypothetical protein
VLEAQTAEHGERESLHAGCAAGRGLVVHHVGHARTDREDEAGHLAAVHREPEQHLRRHGPRRVVSIRRADGQAHGRQERDALAHPPAQPGGRPVRRFTGRAQAASDEADRVDPSADAEAHPAGNAVRRRRRRRQGRRRATPVRGGRRRLPCRLRIWRRRWSEGWWVRRGRRLRHRRGGGLLDGCGAGRGWWRHRRRRDLRPSHWREERRERGERRRGGHPH